MKNPIVKVLRYHSALGPRGAAAFLAAKLRGTQPLFETRVPGIAHPVFLRLATTDLSVLRQVLIEGHYDFPLPWKPRVIVDAGANIGLSAVFFANRHPQARIIAVEPDESNLSVLRRNVSSYPNITTVKGALWHCDTELDLCDFGEGHDGFRTLATPNDRSVRRARVPAFTLPELMKKTGVEHVDLLKLDIEGAEKEVLSHCAPWIDSVRAIMAELHDGLQPGCSQSFADATRGFDVPCRRGETVLRHRRDNLDPSWHSAADTQESRDGGSSLSSRKEFQ